MISVVIPLYNKSSKVRTCLDSVFKQTVLPNELIIIDDGSTDDSLEVVRTYVDSHSQLQVHIIEQENSGVSRTRNRGVSLSKNQYVAFLDADDEWNERFIESAQEVISRHENISLYTCKHRICEEGIGCFSPKQKFGSEESGIIRNYFSAAKSNELVNSSKAIVNKSHFLAVGGFPENAKVSEDLFLWIKLSECAPIAYLDKLLVTIHQAPDNSRDLRVGEIPYPIIYYSSKHIAPILHNDFYLLLWSIHFNHVLGSCTKNKKEALKRILYGTKLFKFKGVLLLPLLIIPKFIFNFIRIKRRNKMVKASA
jgi:glycosyltransferase involved in cell wall biosynthesis